MKIKLHEIELSSQDPEASKRFYHELLGLPIYVDQEGLKVFDSGWAGLDLDTSVHFPGQVSLSFLVEDSEAFARGLRAKGIPVDDPQDTHLGMRAFELADPDGHRVEIHSPTEQSPEWLRDLVK